MEAPTCVCIETKNSFLVCGLGFALGIAAPFAQIAVPALTPALSKVAYAADTTGTSISNPYDVVDTSQPTENPFPDMVPNEVVAKSTKPDQKSSDTMIYYQVLELKDGSFVNPPAANDNVRAFNYSTQLAEWTTQVKALHTYLVLPKTDSDHIYSNTYDVGSFYTDNWHGNSSTYNPQKAGATLDRMKLTSLKINGKEVSTNYQYLRFKSLENTQYIEATWEFPENSYPTILRLASYPGLVSGSPAATSIIPINAYAYTEANFHFVDEDQYRSALNLSPTAQIPERSAGTGAFSDAAFKALSLTDLADPVKTSGITTLGRNDRNSDAAAIMSSPLLYLENTSNEFKKNYEKQPGTVALTDQNKASYADLQNTQIKGYVYLADDIDKAPNPSAANAYTSYMADGVGNQYLTPARAADGTLLTKKDYYLLYRALPSPVDFSVYKDDAAFSGASFDLYAIVDGKEVLIKKGLTTDKEGNIYLSGTDTTYSNLQAVAKNDANYNPDKNAFVVTADDGSTTVYLKTGNYRLKPQQTPGVTNPSNFNFEIGAVDLQDGADNELYTVVSKHFDIHMAAGPVTPEPDKPEPEKPADMPETPKDTPAKAQVSKAALPKTSDPYMAVGTVGFAAAASLVLAKLMRQKKQQ